MKFFATPVVLMLLCGSSYADTFGTGAHTFDIEFVAVGDPGNIDAIIDSPASFGPLGAVPYSYRIGKFEISESMIDAVNALNGLQISQDDRGANKPATSVSWMEAARFVNWLNTSTGGLPAYKFASQPGEAGYNSQAVFLDWEHGEPGYNPQNTVRNSLARYFLPSPDEWFKAAYYDPASASYLLYPTGSDTPPTAVASGTDPNTAVFNGQSGPADVTIAGGLSAYDTMAQGGNVAELQELTSIGFRFRGGAWSNSVGILGPWIQSYSNGISSDSRVGFRVASVAVPEPSGILLATLFLTPALSRRSRGCH